MSESPTVAGGRQGPTLVLALSAGITALMTLVAVFAAVATPIAIALDPATPPDDPPPWAAAVVYGGFALVALLSCVLQARGALSLHRRESVTLAWAGAAGALMSGMCCCNGWNLAAGLYLAVVLIDPEFTAGFEGGAD